MEVTTYLQQSKHLEELIRNNQLELASLKDLATSISALDYSKIKVVEGSDCRDARFTEIIEKIMELEEKTKDEILKLVNLRISLNNSMTELPFEEQVILKKKYFRGMTWETLAKEMGMSPRTAIRIHNKSLKKLQIGQSCHCLS